MAIDLISEADYERLPSDPYQKFAALEGVCRRNMLEAISNETSGDFDDLVRTSYMTIVAAAADELGVEGIRYIDGYDNVQLDVQEFIRVVSGVVARIRLRKSSGRDGFSVRLANRTKGIIENEVAKLREAVAESDLDEAKKRRLLGKLEEFRTELHKERLGYGAALSTLAIVAAGLGGTTAFLSDAPNAVTTIIQLIGQDKESEEAELLRLEGPAKPRFLTDQSRSATPKASRYVEDEDIPF
ncbi:hypothetical protein [Ensifer adhaerens]|uniref:hypothetical protein n=1 Tax=Ensifer adhaerens TaxID=106592 RepID=UPI001C4E237C|nr:hypothetical protein [Ensifer adhaerens]MBW0367920.1 hypothetical protein [Ensifer adhaerens]UCM24478.1 hypothetical protein LDL63_32735 [Ensifer adhaerens]